MFRFCFSFKHNPPNGPRNRQLKRCQNTAWKIIVNLIMEFFNGKCIDTCTFYVKYLFKAKFVKQVMIEVCKLLSFLHIFRSKSKKTTFLFYLGMYLYRPRTSTNWRWNMLNCLKIYLNNKGNSWNSNKTPIRKSDNDWVV